VSAGEPLNPEVIEVWRKAFGITILDGYGQTENSLIVANLVGQAVRPGSMGKPTPGYEVVVLDEDGNVCAPARSATSRCAPTHLRSTGAITRTRRRRTRRGVVRGTSPAIARRSTTMATSGSSAAPTT